MDLVSSLVFSYNWFVLALFFRSLPFPLALVLSFSNFVWLLEMLDTFTGNA